MRPLALLAYLAYLIREILAGSWRVARAVCSPGPTPAPAIVEFPLRCTTDLQITALAASITMTPTTLVVGTAAAAGDEPPRLFVHALYAPDRERVLAGLRDMESRLLRAAGMTEGTSGGAAGGAHR